MPIETDTPTQILENVLTPYGVAPHPYVGTRAMSPQGDTGRFTSIVTGPGYLITLTRKANTTQLKPCCGLPCPIPTDTTTIPLAEGQSLIREPGVGPSAVRLPLVERFADLGEPWFPSMGLGASLYTHTPAFNFKYENTIDVPPYWAGALLAKGCSRNGSITLPIPSRQHFEVVENYNTQFYYVNRVPIESLPHHLCQETLVVEEGSNGRVATMAGVYGFTSYLIYEGRPELSLDLQAVGILGIPWSSAHIPSNYQHGVYWERLAFLRGVMDYRGSISDKGVAQLLVTSVEMLEDLHYLVRRLGGWTEITTCGCCDDPCGWLVDILLPNGESPFHITPERYTAPINVLIPPWVVTKIEYTEDVISSGPVTPGSTYFIYPDVLVGEL